MLVVDDNTDDAVLLGGVLCHSGRQDHVGAPSIRDRGAQSPARQGNGQRPCLVIMDDLLPDMHGSDLADVMARDPVFGSPRVVLVSGQPQAGRTGAWMDWLTKPATWQGWVALALDLSKRFLLPGVSSH